MEVEEGEDVEGRAEERVTESENAKERQQSELSRHEYSTREAWNRL